MTPEQRRVAGEIRRLRKIVTIAMELDKYLAWYENVVLDGYNLSHRSNGWLLVIKVSTDRGPKVCFTGGHTTWACWEQFLLDLHRGEIRWREDKFRQE